MIITLPKLLRLLGGKLVWGAFVFILVTSIAALAQGAARALSGYLVSIDGNSITIENQLSVRTSFEIDGTTQFCVAGKSANGIALGPWLGKLITVFSDVKTGADRQRPEHAVRVENGVFLMREVNGVATPVFKPCQ